MHEPPESEMDMNDEEPEAPAEPEFLEWVRGRYNPAPPTPVEEMWAGIEGAAPAGAAPAAGSRGVSAMGVFRHAGALRMAAGVLLLLTGVGIGRITLPAGSDAPGAESGPAMALSDGEVEQASADRADRSASERLPTFAHLREADMLLAILTEEGRDVGVREQSARWAESLLLETEILRMLQVDGDPEMAGLLDALESTLRLVVGLGAPGEEAERLDALESITRTLDDQKLRTRIHSVLPGAS